MRRILFLISIIGGIIAGSFITDALPHIDRIDSISSEIAPAKNFPIILDIQKLNISAHIEQVGLDKEGRMDIPKDVNNVAWYNLGPKPGERGNAVINGHRDSPTAPAIFYNLGLLEAGDEIIVTDEKSSVHKFVVTGKVIYRDDEFPLEQVFGATDEPMLNLITCRGKFDRKEENYSQRLVVYTRLVE